MSISDKIIQLNQVKQDIKQAIEDKGVAMLGVPFTNYPLKINEISGGGGLNLVGVWEDYKRTPELKYDLNLTLAASNVEMSGFNIDIYIGDSVLTQLYNDCVGGVINYGDLYVLDHDILPLAARTYFGDVSDFVGMPFPLYGFGLYGNMSTFELSYATAFLVGDLTPLGMGVGISLVKLTTGLIFDNIKVYEKYNNYRDGLIADLNEVGLFFDVVYDFPLVIPDIVTSIGNDAFRHWEANNQPLVIGNSVTSIGNDAFYNWTANDQPLVIGNSVTSIGNDAFRRWEANNHPLVIPNSVTSIGNGAFSNWETNNHPLVIPNSVTSISAWAFQDWTANNHPLVIPDSVISIEQTAFYNWNSTPYAEIHATTPPTLGTFNFNGSYPIYVPDGSVDDYKTATNWVALASRIFSINEK